MVYENIIDNSGDVGIGSSNSCVSLISNEINDSCNQAIYAFDGNEAIIDGNHVSGTGKVAIGGKGISGSIITEKCLLSEICDNQITDSGKHGIAIYGEYVVTDISENKILSATENGITIDKSIATVAQNNVICDCGLAGIMCISGSSGKIFKNEIESTASGEINITESSFILEENY